MLMIFLMVSGATRPISLAEYDIPIPFKTPDPSSVERILVDLSDEVYRKYEKQVRSLML